MNKFRAVQDTDEYDTVYQCMSCFQTWAARYFGTQYCSHCGIKFEGQLECRPHDIPRWKWDRWGAEDIPREIDLGREEQQLRWPKPAPGAVWKIESALEEWIDPKGEEAWSTHRILRGKECTAYEAKRWLEFFRREESDDDCDWPGRVLFRVRRAGEAERAFFAVAR